MTNITQKVWRIIETDPSIRTNLSRGIINNRALAKFISEQLNDLSTTNAIISAIRRYRSEKSVHETVLQAMKNLKGVKIISRSDIVSIILEKDRETEKLLPELFRIIRISKYEVLRVVQGNRTIIVIIDDKNLKQAKELFPNDKIIKVQRRLAEIDLELDTKQWNTPGITAVISAEIAARNVNLVEFMSCEPEIMMIFEEKDLMRAYKILYNAVKQA